MWIAPPSTALLLINITDGLPLILIAQFIPAIAPPWCSALLPLKVKIELSSMVTLPISVNRAPPAYVTLLLTNITDALPFKII